MPDDASVAQLDALITTITVDCYHEAEAETAFLTAIEQEAAPPTFASLLGDVVKVVGYDFRGVDSTLSARCQRDQKEAWINLDALVFEPGSAAAWIHAAYRRFHGLTPHSVVPPAGWSGLDWLA